MKKHILLIVCLCSCLIGQSQNSSSLNDHPNTKTKSSSSTYASSQSSDCSEDNNIKTKHKKSWSSISINDTDDIFKLEAEFGSDFFEEFVTICENNLGAAKVKSNSKAQWEDDRNLYKVFIKENYLEVKIDKERIAKSQNKKLYELVNQLVNVMEEDGPQRPTHPRH